MEKTILRDIRKLEKRTDDLNYQNGVLYWTIQKSIDENLNRELQAIFDENEKLIYKLSDAIEHMYTLYDLLCDLA